MTDHETAGKARAFEFTFSADAEPERLRFVIGDGYGFERLHGRDRMGVERWVPHTIDEQDFDACARALLIECTAVPSTRAEIERLRVRAEQAEREWVEARAEVERWRVRAEQGEREPERNNLRAEAADGDGWLVEGLPPLGAWVDVRVDSGDVYTGEVVSAYAGSRGLRLRGPLAVPADHCSGGHVEWCTWDDPSYSPHERRTGWRLAKKPSGDEPQPEAERLPDGWTWTVSNEAMGPDFVDRTGDTMRRMVWIKSDSLQFQFDRDEEPLDVVRAVIARHDRLTRERGQ